MPFRSWFRQRNFLFFIDPALRIIFAMAKFRYGYEIILSSQNKIGDARQIFVISLYIFHSLPETPEDFPCISFTPRKRTTLLP